MSEIEVTVRVPADLEVVRDTIEPKYSALRSSMGDCVFQNEGGHNLYTTVFQQIAAAIEARRPRPPKFQVGDVVEWDAGSALSPNVLAGIIYSVVPALGEHGISYVMNEGDYEVMESDLTLVRRAAK